ncbi:ABC transporter ATP-binding protein/permease [Rhizobium glycinendophyticum]|uniref:ABC transporter ATP-binding protein/permease n=1 Tax=Rhizobium glycinendophyticum TaxID=2589807 RepID=A0A504TXL5_9HYPH|nr:ABC transporter ATP-binding protein/permease [Rhizobium glycinendophyticum]TPP07264.1 ABC transporter ATP-binding protein/permease [Rhizobium glycinendophyticum]
MTSETSGGPISVDQIVAAVEGSFRRQIAIALDSFWHSAIRNRILVFAFALVAVILATAYGTVMLNHWNAPFYNSLEQRNLPAFLQELRNFAVIAGVLLVLNVIQAWLNQMTALHMREGLTRDVIDQWLAGRRAFRLSMASPLGVNPDQRLHEDARKLAEMTTSLSIGLFNATILLVSFIGVLWGLSSDLVFKLGDWSFQIPGYMVWGAILYALAASLLSRLVGHRLSNLNAERYAREADLRFSLMRANENLDAIAVARGEDAEKRHIHETLDGVLGSIRNLALALTNLTWVTAGFGWLAIIVPILIASPAYFSGTITFGGLMMAAAAFTQVYSALRWYVDNFGQIADWRAALLRVTVFRAALDAMDNAEQMPGRIEILPSEDGALRLRGLEIGSRLQGENNGGAFRLVERDVEIAPGQHVMVNGDQGVNRKLFFNALAGLWPFGKGKIFLPAATDILFIPQIGYLPEGSLRSLLAYPLASANFTDSDMKLALEKVGLGNLGGRLYERARWERLLDKDEQMALAFANMLLRKPRWVVLFDVLEGLEPDTEIRLAALLGEMPDASLLYIGRSAAFAKATGARLVHLERMMDPPR